jgi:hypothetical protein
MRNSSTPSENSYRVEQTSAVYDMTKMKIIACALLIYMPLAWAQCGAGIPGAGNPGCIPPTVSGSPYGQPSEAGTFIPAPARAVWEDRWGAVAMDLDADASGSTSDGFNEDRASHSALDDCAAQGGIHCQIVLTYHNQCAAITQSAAGIYSSATAANKSEAESRVIAKCGDAQTCRVLYSQCAVPVRIQ